jgi:Pyruvate/2-oxoacid:ferredoxin oxidoreductase gamma subunit
VSLEQIEAVVRQTFAAKPSVVDVNLEALHRGFELGRATRPAEATA